MATLTYNPGHPDEKCFTIGNAVVTIGRAEDQTICIPHKSLSRSHARLEPAEGRFILVDQGSKHGTLVNGVRVQRTEVRHGDTVTLGDVDLLFRVEQPSSLEHQGSELQPQATRALLRPPLTKLAGDVSRRDAGERTRLRLLLEVARLLPVSKDVDALLRKVVELLFQVLDIDRCALLLIDKKTRRLEPRVVKTSQLEDEGWPVHGQKIAEYVLRQSVAALFIDSRASMCAPLKPKDDVIGVLYVDTPRSTHPFSEDDLDFLVAFASQTALALDNATLHRRLEQESVARMQLMEAKLASLNMTLSGLAHELRNPLNFMTHFAELSSVLAGGIAEELGAQSARLPENARVELEDMLANLRENTSRIGEHGRRANAIIQSMLTHGPRAPSAREAVDLNAVVAESVRLARGGPQGRDVEVRVLEEYDAAIGLLEIAPLDMGRVFLNVAENALYSLREKKRERGGDYVPELRVHTAARGDHVEVRVRDNGMGIPKQLVEKLFEPFFTTKPKGQGTGLGLSLSRDIVVHGHQGTMRVESEAGEGTEVVVTLPQVGRNHEGDKDKKPWNFSGRP